MGIRSPRQAKARRFLLRARAATAAGPITRNGTLPLGPRLLHMER